MSGPLAGIRILEVGHMLAGPYCGLLLADLGAEVIKIEPPEGDIGRRVSPHQVGAHNAYFASLNRSKKSVVIDLATADGQTKLARLAGEAHALVTNLRPSAIRKLGLTYEALRIHNQRLVCVALTGYGLDGEHAQRPAYDYVIQAISGVMAITGDPHAAPTKAGYSAVDNSAGIMAALGLLARIIEGRGGQVDVAMFDVMLSQLNYLAGASLNAGEIAARQADSAHPYIVPAQLFRASDGWLMLFITHDGFWRRFCEELQRPDWLADSRFSTMAARRQHRAVVLAAIGEHLARGSVTHWVERLEPLGIVVSGVDTLEQALDSALTRSREMVVDIACEGARLRAVGSAIKCEGHQPEFTEPPRLGQHTVQLLGGAAAIAEPCRPDCVSPSRPAARPLGFRAPIVDAQP